MRAATFPAPKWAVNPGKRPFLVKAMRAKAGDPPRTMPQKIFAGRADDPTLSHDLVRLKVDQVFLTRDANRGLSEAKQLGMKKAAVEVAVAYETRCVTENGPAQHEGVVSREVLGAGVLIARPGIGFPAAVHL